VCAAKWLAVHAFSMCCYFIVDIAEEDIGMCLTRCGIDTLLTRMDAGLQGWPGRQPCPLQH
jgi:hypothetical protein